MEFPFTVPPQASFPFIYFERSSRSISVGSRPSITVTSFPYRRLFTLTLIRCCSFATSSQIQSSFGSPHVGQIPPIITCIFTAMVIYYLALKGKNPEKRSIPQDVKPGSELVKMGLLPYQRGPLPGGSQGH